MPRLGIVGTMVWDSIHAPGGADGPVRDWGGIAYSLSAFAAAAPADWEVVPIIKVGSDLRASAEEFFRSLPRMAALDFVRTVAEPNNRVDLFYHDRSRRCEKLTGGVPGWTWSELAPAVEACDALYVNFIAGWEIDLETAVALGRDGGRPTYCDVHSLILGVTGEGVREPRALPNSDEWLGAFDLVQVNEDELDTLAGSAGDRASRVGRLLSAGPDAVLVTLGRRGSEWWARPGSRWLRTGDMRLHDLSPLGPHRAEGREEDPTGCGDVWGVTCFTALLGGASLPEATERANRFAARCAVASGTAGLVNRLAGVERSSPARGERRA